MSGKQVGIEEARKTLGTLVNEVQYTGRGITLTRSGTPVAVLNTIEGTPPGVGIPVLVLFPDEDHTVSMPAIPRVGDAFEWTDADGRESFWRVADVVWPAGTDGFSTVGIHLNPAPAPGKDTSKETSA